MENLFKMKNYKIVENNIEYDVMEDFDGTKYWYLNNLFHRENGPAIEYINGQVEYYKYGKCHREDGPARILPDGTKQYWLNDEAHREDGAAQIHPDGTKDYWLNGNYYPDIQSDEEWVKLVPIIDILT